MKDIQDMFMQTEDFEKENTKVIFIPAKGYEHMTRHSDPVERAMSLKTAQEKGWLTEREISVMRNLWDYMWREATWYDTHCGGIVPDCDLYLLGYADGQFKIAVDSGLDNADSESSVQTCKVLWIDRSVLEIDGLQQEFEINRLLEMSKQIATKIVKTETIGTLHLKHEPHDSPPSTTTSVPQSTSKDQGNDCDHDDDLFCNDPFACSFDDLFSDWEEVSEKEEGNHGHGNSETKAQEDH